MRIRSRSPATLPVLVLLILVVLPIARVARAEEVMNRAQNCLNVQLKAEIYSYARSHGAFAGISLDGTQLKVDDDADAAFYGAQDISPDLVVVGDVPEEPQVADQIVNLLSAHTPNTP